MRVAGRVMSEVCKYGLWVAKEYLSGRLGVEDFAQEFGGVYFFAREHREDELVNRFATAVMARYAEFSGGHIDELAFQKELAIVILPFERVELSLRPDLSGEPVVPAQLR